MVGLVSKVKVVQMRPDYRSELIEGGKSVPVGCDVFATGMRRDLFHIDFLAVGLTKHLPVCCLRATLHFH